MKIPKTIDDNSYARENFSNIVSWARDNHPFYQERLSGSLTEVPILTRQDILDNNELLLNGYPVTAQTSGSTGVPVKISWSKKRCEIEQKATNRFVAWLGGRLNITQITHLEEAQKNKNQFIDVNTSVDAQIERLLQRYRDYKAVGITTYPTNAERLCNEVLARNLDMSFIVRFGCYAEVFEPYQEALIQQAFPNAKIWSSYSSREMGIIAARCPHEPGYHHVFAGKLGVEILDEQGDPCEPGKLGRIVLTDYFNTQSPLIRYEIGDLAAHGECPCGKINFPALSSIKGKVRGALVHRNGERVPFTDLSVALRDIPGMRQYQVIQHQLESFELRFVTELQGEELEAFKKEALKQFTNHFAYQPALVFTQEQEIERGENGKYYASISHV